MGIYTVAIKIIYLPSSAKIVLMRRRIEAMHGDGRMMCGEPILPLIDELGCRLCEDDFVLEPSCLGCVLRGECRFEAAANAIDDVKRRRTRDLVVHSFLCKEFAAHGGKTMGGELSCEEG